MDIMKISQHFDYRRLLPILSLGMVIGAIDLPAVISFAILIYSGELMPFAGAGIGLVLFGGLIIQLIIALTSSIPGIMGGPKDGSSNRSKDAWCDRGSEICHSGGRCHANFYPLWRILFADWRV